MVSPKLRCAHGFETEQEQEDKSPNRRPNVLVSNVECDARKLRDCGSVEDMDERTTSRVETMTNTKATIQHNATTFDVI